MHAAAADSAEAAVTPDAADDVGNEKPVELTGAAKNLKREGGCVAFHCAEGCQAFAYTGSSDGFRICECGHTQNIHRNGEPA